MFILLLKTMRSQLHLNWWLTLRLAFYSGVAATDYRINKYRENFPRVEKNLIKFYKTISDHCTEPFDYEKAANLELEWWNIHRYPGKYKKSLEESLADAASAMYNTDPTTLKTYAKYRGRAMLLPNHEGDKQSNPPDYGQIKDMCVKSWTSLHNSVQIT
jgi:hypothetical protein